MQFIAHNVCDMVCRSFIILQLCCLDSFLVVVGLVGICSAHRSVGLFGEKTFLDLTIAGFLSQACPNHIH